IPPTTSLNRRLCAGRARARSLPPRRGRRRRPAHGCGPGRWQRLGRHPWLAGAQRLLALLAPALALLPLLLAVLVARAVGVVAAALCFPAVAVLLLVVTVLLVLLHLLGRRLVLEVLGVGELDVRL